MHLPWSGARGRFCSSSVRRAKAYRPAGYPWHRRALFEEFEDRRLLSITPDGNEFLVNQLTDGAQWTTAGAAAVAMSAPGRFVVTFNGNGPGDSSGVFVQQFNGADQPILEEARANTTIQGSQQFASLAANSSGDFVAAWSGNGPGDSSGVFLQRFRADVSKVGPEVRVNSTTGGNQLTPAVAIGTDGTMVVAWAGKGQGDDWGVFLQRFNANGTRLGGEGNRSRASG